jgi:hypothetical protein
MSAACIAVAATTETGNQTTAPAMTSSAPSGVSFRQVLKTHAMPTSNV